MGRTIRVGGHEAFIDRVELAADHAVVVWRMEEAEGEDAGASRVELVVDGAPLEPLPSEASPGPARAQGTDARSVSYPVPRAAGSAHLVVRLNSGEESPATRVPLS